MVASRHSTTVYQLRFACGFGRHLTGKLTVGFSGVAAISKHVSLIDFVSRFFADSPQGAACAVINRFFRQQPAVAELLSKHSGQSFRLVAKPVDATMTISHDGYLSPADKAIAPDVVLTVNGTSLLRTGWRPGQPLPEGPGFVHISGDAALAQTLSMLANSWRPDLEDLLAGYVGDIAARQLISRVQGVSRALVQSTTRFAQNVAEYAAYESDELVAQPELLSHHEANSDLSRRLNGLKDRVKHLEARSHALSCAAGSGS